MDLLTEMTGWPVCVATRSAVRWRVPDSSGDQMNGGSHDMARAVVYHDRAVHLGEFTQPGGRELDLELETAGTQGFHRGVVAQHDQRSGVAAQDPLQPIPQCRTRRNRSKSGSAPLVSTLFDSWHRIPGGH